MAPFRALPISRKLPAVIVALCLTASLTIAVLGYRDFQNNMTREARSSFDVLTQSRSEALIAWFDRLQSEVANLGRDPTIVSAMNAFSSSYNLMIDSAGLRDAYIVNNANPVGEKELLDRAPEAVPYNFQHGDFHPYIRQVRDEAGFPDLLLISKAGEILYSVAKRDDFATNVTDGAETGLARVFEQAMNGARGDVFFADFAPYSVAQTTAEAFLASPVTDASENILGVVVVQVPRSQIGTIINNPLGLRETGEIYLVGEDFRTRSQSRFVDSYGLLHDVGDLAQARAALEHEPNFMTAEIGVNGRNVMAKVSHFDALGLHWGIVGEIDTAEVNAPVAAVRNKMIVASLIVGVFSILAGGLIARSFVNPLSRLGEAMQSISDRDYDVAVAETNRGDEIGRLARSLMEFRDKLAASDAVEDERRALQAEQAEVVETLSKALTELADGDLTHDISTALRGDYDQLRQNYNRTIDHLNATIGAVVLRAGDISERAEGLSDASDDLSRRTENQAATLEETAAALDELTTSVRSAADGARQVADVVGNARKDAEESLPVVEKAVQAMTEIETSSEEIAKIIGVIDDIAFQTNLLALNAGVEAARAGDAGRGFAVVASEVRALAQRSSDAAKQIKSLISESSGQVERGVGLVGQAGHVLTKIAGHINHVSDLIGEIASGAEEQSVGLAEINLGVTQLDEVTQQNAAMVDQATGSSHALKGDASELAEMVQRFRLKDGLGVTGGRIDEIAVFEPKPARVSDLDTGNVSAPRAIISRSSAKLKQDIWEDF